MTDAAPKRRSPHGGHGGSKPGERRGGRQKNSKNKKTIERELETQARQIIAADPSVTKPKLAKEVLEQFMHVFAGMAARVQPTLVQDPAHPNDPSKKIITGEFEKFERWSGIAMEFATRLARYQSPTFTAVALSPLPDANAVREVKRFTFRIFEDRKLIEHIPAGE